MQVEGSGLMKKNILFSLCGLAICSNAFSQHCLNLESTYSDIKSQMQNGGGQIMCIGDSLTYRSGAFFDNFRNRVQAEYGNGGYGYQGISRWTGAGVNPHWIEGAINQDVEPHRGLDGLWLSHENQNTTSAFVTPRNNIAELIYATGPEYSTFFLVPTVGNAVTVNSYEDSPNIAIQVFNCLNNSQNWIYPSNNGKTTLLGINNLSGNSGPVLHRAANGGYGIGNFLQRDYTFDRIARYLNIELYVVMLGQNDGALNQSDYEVRLTLLKNRLRTSIPNCDILFVSSYNSGGPNGLQHSNAMRNVASTYGLGYIDLYTVGGDRNFYLNNGYLDVDGLHFSQAGGAYVANLIFDALETNGESLPKICDSIDYNNDGNFPDTLDLDQYMDAFSGNPCDNCNDIDFNNDSYFPDTLDIDSLLSVFSGGPCL